MRAKLRCSSSLGRGWDCSARLELHDSFPGLCPPGGAGPPLSPLGLAEGGLAAGQSSVSSFALARRGVPGEREHRIAQSSLAPKAVSLFL